VETSEWLTGSHPGHQRVLAVSAPAVLRESESSRRTTGKRKGASTYGRILRPKTGQKEPGPVDASARVRRAIYKSTNTN
jgi:hypothetical protein